MFAGARLTLARLSNWLDGASRVFLIFSFAVMILACLLQVFCRYVLNDPLSWPEELTIYLMAWMTFIGSAVAIKSSEHIAVDIVLNFLPERFRDLLLFIVKIVTLFIVVYLFKAGLGLTTSSTKMISDALGISMVWPRISMPIGAVLMAIHLVHMIISDIEKLFGSDVAGAVEEVR